MVSSIPNIKWAERKDRLFVTIELNEVKEPKINLTDDNRLTFTGKVENTSYNLDIELFGEVNKAESKWTLDTRNILINIKKKNKGPYWNYINKDKKKYNFIHVDWQMFLDEDEEEGMKSFPGFGGGNSFQGDLDNIDPIPMEDIEFDHDDDTQKQEEKENKVGMENLDKPSQL